MKTTGRLIQKIIFAIPVSVLLIVSGALAVGAGFDNWGVGALVGSVALWPLAPVIAGPFCDTPPFFQKLVMTGEFTPDSFAGMIKQLRDQVNAMLAGLPPLEQYEASSELSYGLRALASSARNLVELSASLEEAVKTYASKITSVAEQSAEAKLLEKGEYIKKTDAQTATQTAVTEKEKEVRGSFDAEKKEVARVTAAREKLVTVKVCSEAVANALTADFFKEEGFADRVSKLTARIKTLMENKLTADEFVAEMAAIPMDEAGDKIFESRVNSVKNLVSHSASRTGGPNLIPGALPSGEPNPEVVLIF